ncbi:MAG: ribose-5-phosphate isomerase RpiA [Saprospiraceae bacterium]|nr:ribose-5-phosphate isomerase RpiA [Saprospiraceae bacterium]
MNVKKLAGEAATGLVESGMTVGLGTGSTAYWSIMKLGEKVKMGLEIKCIATSTESEQLARKLEISIVDFTQVHKLDVTIDGADEVDPQLNLIKGGGGALLREKIVAAASVKLVIVVDQSKIVSQLGAFPLPVEVIPFGIEVTRRKIELLGCRTHLRTDREGSPFHTDNGNLILDCSFGKIENAEIIEQQLNMIPGVVENGLFLRMADQVFIGYENGEVKVMK